MTQVYDQAEIDKFDALAHRWWDPSGPFSTLHTLNPLRSQWIAGQFTLAQANGLDLGCGGGLLTEALAKLGANMTGLDASESAIMVAKAHAKIEKVNIAYHAERSDAYLKTAPKPFDFVICLELLEHLPEPAQIIQDCANLVRPGGDVVFSTLNRHPKSFVHAILGAEYILKLVPKTTHRYDWFIKPSELTAWAKQADLRLVKCEGIAYHPFTKTCSLTQDLHVNYIAHFKKA